MRPAHVTRDGRVICSVPGCGELLARLFRHPEFEEAIVAEILPWYVFDHETGIWRPTRFYRERGIPFRRRPLEHGSYLYRVPEIGFDIRENLTLARNLDLPMRAQRGQPLPATIRCRHGHLSVINPAVHEAIEAWYDHGGVLHRS